VFSECQPQTVTRLFTQQQTGIFRDRLDARRFPVVSAQRRVSARCQAGDAALTPVRFEEPSPTPAPGPTPGGAAASDGGHWLLATALPAAVILALLLLAALAACALRRRRSSAKRSSDHSLASHPGALNGDARPGGFVSKGAPVIFPDEIDRASVGLHRNPFSCSSFIGTIMHFTFLIYTPIVRLNLKV